MKQKESKQRPTPWHVMYDEDGNVDGIFSGEEIIVETYDGYYPPKSNDAEFIVTAVNSFEADRELIKELSSLLNAVSPYLDNKGYVLYSKQIKDALAKNRGF